MLELRRTWRGRRETLHVRVAGPGAASVGDETLAALQAGIAAVERAGFSPGHLMRSRLWASDSAARGAASDVRRAFLAGPLRAASASFWGPDNLPSGARVMLDLEALQPAAGATKSVVEYVPAITPPAFVTLDGMVFLSGNTDQSRGLAAQVAAIAAKIRASLARAGSSSAEIVTLSAYLAETENPAAAEAAIRRALPEPDCPLSLTIVRGFSAPDKLLEIEVDAEIGRSPAR